MSLQELMPIEQWRQQHAAHLFPSAESLRWFCRTHPQVPIVRLRNRKHVAADQFGKAVEKILGVRK